VVGDVEIGIVQGKIEHFLNIIQFEIVQARAEPMQEIAALIFGGEIPRISQGAIDVIYKFNFQSLACANSARALTESLPLCMGINPTVRLRPDIFSMLVPQVLNSFVC